MNLVVSIGRVVVNGLPAAPASGARVGRLAETALQRLLVERGVPEGLAGRDLRDLVAPDLHLPAGAGDDALAERLALAVYRALGGR